MRLAVLTATDQRHNFNLIPVLKHALGMLLSRHQSQISLYGTIAIVDLQMLQQITDGPVLLDLVLFSVDVNADHDAMLSFGNKFGTVAGRGLVPI